MNEILKKKMWCYSAPDGEIQTRSLQETKNICRIALAHNEYKNGEKVTYKDYEKAGYKLHRVLATIQIKQTK